MKMRSVSSSFGTPLYTAPEYKNFRKYDERIDVYSLGIIYLELLSDFYTESQKIKTILNLRNKHELP